MGIDGYSKSRGAAIRAAARNAKQQQQSNPSATTSTPIAKATSGNSAAPVDGKDGKPHAGPWVDSTVANDAKKSAELPGKADKANSKKPQPKPDGDAVKEAGDSSGKTDGVMNDPHRKPPEGSTGTEGGVSEKTKDKETKGADAQKVPESPSSTPSIESPSMHASSDDGMFSESQLNSGGSASHGKSPAAAGSRAAAIAQASPPATGENTGGAAGLKKPDSLPPTPHGSKALPVPVGREPAASHPLVPGGALDADDKFNPNAPSSSSSSSSSSPSEGSSLLQPLHSFILSFAMIIFSEIGDKTFLVACLMAMRHPRLQVFTSAFAALIVMTVLSAVLGHAVPTLIPKRFTNLIAAVLFLVFGAKLLREGLAMDAHDGVGAEMAEVEQELEEKEELARKHGRRRSSQISPYALEAGRRSASRLGQPTLARIEPSPPSSPESPSFSRSSSPGSLEGGIGGNSSRDARRAPPSSSTSPFSGLSNLLSLLLSPVWVQTFAMTFFAEWGDRSQIATIAMAAGQDYWWVTAGAVVGHALCTGGAVLGGKAIAGRVSLRIVTLGGAGAFIFFGIVYAAEGWTAMGD